jgi:hypothetical protein
MLGTGKERKKLRSNIPETDAKLGQHCEEVEDIKPREEKGVAAGWHDCQANTFIDEKLTKIVGIRMPDR